MLKHEHILIRAELFKPPTDISTTETWLKNLIEDLDMEIMIGPFGEYSVVPGNEGLTIGACITTSHIMMHVWDRNDPPVMHLDVYSCKAVNSQVVLAALDEFEPTKIDFKFLDRDKGFIEISC